MKVMQKRKILVIIPGLNHGGTNRSLLNLLEEVDKEKYQIDILPIYREGAYSEKLKKYSVLSPKNLFPLYDIINHKKIKNSKLIFLQKKIYHFYISISLKYFKNKFMKILNKHIKKLGYDVIIAFQENLATEIVSNIDAKERIAWIRCDYARYLKLKNIDEKDMYIKFNHIIAVSKYTSFVFKECIPEVADKVQSIYNIIDYKSIKKLGQDKIEDQRFRNDKFTLISVGRFDPVKRFSFIPQIAAKLKRKDIDFYWYLIGDGEEKNNILDKIEEEGVSDTVMLLGAKNNPYPYICNSNVLVCLSESEACPNVINEAKILHIPVVTSDFPSAFEFIESSKNGYIVSINEFSDIIEKLICNKEIYDRLKSQIKDFRYDNSKIINTIENLLDGKNLR